MDLDIFEVHHTLVRVCGREPLVSPERDGSLLVEVSFPEESARRRKISQVLGGPVSCAPHATLSCCKGVVFSRDPLEREVLQILSKKVGFAEAKRRALSRFVRPGVSYVSMPSSIPIPRPVVPVLRQNAVISSAAPLVRFPQLMMLLLNAERHSPNTTSNWRLPMLLDGQTSTASNSLRTKTVAMTLPGSGEFFVTQICILHGRRLPVVEQIRFLGMVLDHRLTWLPRLMRIKDKVSPPHVSHPYALTCPLRC
ncbi:hypothetical protein Hamer_G000518 [Homarus americanus]|uniref:Uncharacterized protein n=1 Tax=Homarus americanus TaxID=6706 RepID=A0A8J5NCS5_HOMAM|nr:hypothetical protein Hamer_G000518 [Homarus americanus]